MSDNYINKKQNFDFKAYIKRIWTGTSSKTEYLLYYSIVFSIYILGIIISASVYPGGFSFNRVYTSYLGGYPNNPDGYRFYNACEILTGILSIPHFIFLYQRLKPSVRILSWIACLFGIIGYIGFASIGIFHQGTGEPGHGIATWFAFGGLGGAALFLLPVFIRRIVKHEYWPKLWKFILNYGQIFLVGGILLGFPDLFTDQALEWIVIIFVMSFLFGLILMVEEPKKATEIN